MAKTRPEGRRRNSSGPTVSVNFCVVDVDSVQTLLCSLEQLYRSMGDNLLSLEEAKEELGRILMTLAGETL